MVGLAAYALAGGLQGAGTGLAAAATSRREAALRALEREQERSWEIADREDERAWETQKLEQSRAQEIEDREIAHARRSRGGGGGGGRSSGGGGGGGSSSTRLAGEYDIDGVLHGRDPTGQMRPYLAPDGTPVSATATGKGTRAAAGGAPKVDLEEAETIFDDELSTLGDVTIPPDVKNQARHEFNRLVHGGADPFEAAAEVRGMLEIDEEVTNRAGIGTTRGLHIATGGLLGTDPNGPPDETKQVARGLRNAEQPGGVAPTPADQPEGEYPPAPPDPSVREVGKVYRSPNGTLGRWTAQGKWDVIGG